jgi:ERCC4-type nuclease
LPGFEDRAAVERKELNDLISCLMNGNRGRFEKELARGRHYDLFAVVVEASLAGRIPGALSQRHETTGSLTEHHYLSS